MIIEKHCKYCEFVGPLLNPCECACHPVRIKGYTIPENIKMNHRRKLLDLVGITCMGCGLDDLRVLEIDHIKEDGALDRKKFSNPKALYKHYLDHPEEIKRNLQTLCRNCNWLKRNGFELPDLM